jgi:hypothetical protein
LTAAAPVVSLPVAMIEAPFRALLVPYDGATPLLESGLLAAPGDAIAVSPITVRADKENRVTLVTQAKSLPENRFAMNRRHASSQAD